jgi:hypothetical protein
MMLLRPEYSGFTNPQEVRIEAINLIFCLIFR